MTSGCAIELSDLHMSFGGLRVLSDINLRIQAGERRAILGPNGAGKTTLFHLISGELRASAGRIHMLGQEITAMPTYRRAAMGLARTFQRNNLFTGLTVLTNAMLTVQAVRGAAWGLWTGGAVRRAIEAEARAMLEQVGLAERADSPAGLLSYGEQRQLEIGLALAARPAILLLDEPTAGMSAAETARTAELIRRLPPDLTLVMIEHDMDVVAALASTVTVLHYGRVIADGTVEQVKQNPEVMSVYLGTAEEVASD